MTFSASVAASRQRVRADVRLLYTHSDRLASRLIAGFDSGGVSHGGIEFPDHQPGWVLDTTFAHRGVCWWPRSAWESMHGRRLVDDISVSLPDESAAYAWACEQEGKPYDWTAIFGMALLRDWQDEDSWYCFELQIAAAIKGGRIMATRPAEIGGRLSRELAHAWAGARDA